MCFAMTAPQSISPDIASALDKIEQRLNESGTGEMGLLDTIHAAAALVRDVRASLQPAAAIDGRASPDIMKRLLDTSYKGQEGMRREAAAEIKRLRAIRAATPTEGDVEIRTTDMLREHAKGFAAGRKFEREMRTTLTATGGDAVTGEAKAREIVTEWLGMFDPPPQIDFQQSEMLQQGIASAMSKDGGDVAATPTAPVMWVCLVGDLADRRIRAWTADHKRMESLRSEGLDMQPLYAGVAQPSVNLHWLVDWVHLYATEGNSWISKISADKLITLAARQPTQADANRLTTEPLASMVSSTNGNTP
jgi:hypothetical protein